MSGLSLSRMLRPFLVEPLPRKAAAYGRLLSITRPTCLRAFSLKKRTSEKPGKYNVYGEAFVEKGERTEQAIAIKTERRIQRLKELDALRWPRIENWQDVGNMSIPQFRVDFKDLNTAATPPKVQLRGRVLSVRKQSSKLIFLDIRGDFHSVQVMLDYGHIHETSGASLEDYRAKKYALLRGDFVSVEGIPVRNTQGEIVLKADKLPEQLSPSIAPVPTKLINEETKVQEPHLNLLVNKHASNMLRFRSELIWWLRHFFVKRKFLEVQTPILADYAGGAVARPFLTSATEFPHKELALRIAPELWLKRMVVGGFERIFEIGPSFRNEGLDGTHNPEFTMCEFYQAYANLPTLIELTNEMMRTLAEFSADMLGKRLLSSAPVALPPTYFTEFEQVEFIPALEEVLNLRFPDLSAPDALDRLGELLHQNQLGHESNPNVTLNKLLDTLASTYLEPKSDAKPLYITHHPACMSPLSKSFTCPQTGQLVSARAELFVKGREVANMYEEENDPFEQRRKFEQQVKTRQAATADPDSEEGHAVVDESYIQALEHGLPPTGGWGCGVDRLVMLFSGASRLSDTLSFGSLRNVVGVTQGSKRA